MEDIVFAAGCQWCWHPELASGAPRFVLFRRVFTLDKPETMRLLVSADNRYNLYLDGRLLGRGPCRGDLWNYNFERYTENLSEGTHVMAAEVLVYPLGFRREEGPWSEIHTGGGFLASGAAGETVLDSPGAWRCRIDASRGHRTWRDAWPRASTVPAPPMEEVDFSRAFCGWREAAFDDSDWVAPKNVGEPCLRDTCRSDPPTRWMLTERTVAQMLETSSPLAAILSAGGADVRLCGGKLSGRVPAGKTKITLDLGLNQTSMVRFAGRGGSGSCRLAYAELLFEEGKKGFRGVFPGGEVGPHGYSDGIRFGGGKPWCFESFWYRAGRFVELAFDLETPLEIDDFSVRFITYDFGPPAPMTFFDDEDLNAIYRVGFHTALCCAHEHYEDCPYWEQLQYVGDTRIQALISYAVTGNGTLGRQAIRHFDQSRLPDGITQSRYPSNYEQVIPGYSLFWILMVEDYYSYFGDAGVILEHLIGLRSVMNWFENKRIANGLVGHVGYWHLTDWAVQWPEGKSDRCSLLPETIHSLLYADACRAMSCLLNAVGRLEEAALYVSRRLELLAAVNRFCRAPSGLYRDVPEKEWYSQHVNAWAILAGATTDEDEIDRLLAAIVGDGSFTKCSLYFAFYLLELAARRGRGDVFEKVLSLWRIPLERGFTTFPETLEGGRSDSHAWSAGPVYALVRNYFGVQPGTPGFGEVIVAPNPGCRRHFKGTLFVGKGRTLEMEWNAGTLRLCASHPLCVRLTLPGGAEQKVALVAGEEALFP